jgi:hypothetical protein
MDSKPLSTRQVDSDDVTTLRNMLSRKCVEMSQREMDSELKVQKMQREMEMLRSELQMVRSENEGYKQMENLRRSTQDKRCVNLLLCQTCFELDGQSAKLERELRHFKPEDSDPIVVSSSPEKL